MKAIKNRVRLYAGRHPAVFSAIYRLKREHRAVRPTTQLVIEGFPRSANTFAVWAFKQAQAGDVRTAHHLHSPAQVILAARWRIPTLVLIREPKEAVMSWVIWDEHTLDYALRSYIYFYKSVLSCRDAYVLADFKDVTQDYGAVIRRINERFRTEFSPFQHTKENVGKVYERIEELHQMRNGGKTSETRIAHPSEAKKEVKHRLRPELEAPERGELLAEATAIYEHLVSTTFLESGQKY